MNRRSTGNSHFRLLRSIRNIFAAFLGVRACSRPVIAQRVEAFRRIESHNFAKFTALYCVHVNKYCARVIKRNGSMESSLDPKLPCKNIRCISTYFVGRQ
jgi:hypothetical protein